MTNKITFFIVLIGVLVGCTSLAFAQKVTVTGELVTYTRPDPSSEHKQNFTVNYPRIGGVDLSIAKRIESILSYEKAFDFTIDEEKTELQWLEEADYEVTYNDNGILSITISIVGSAAYPDAVYKHFNIDTVRGVRMFPKDLFVKLPTLAAKIKKMQQAEIANAKREIKKDPDAEDVDTNEMFARSNFRVTELNAFRLSPTGVTFFYNYGFPHVMKALQPDGQYNISWREIKPFVKPGSRLAKAVK